MEEQEGFREIRRAWECRRPFTSRQSWRSESRPMQPMLCLPRPSRCRKKERRKRRENELHGQGHGQVRRVYVSPKDERGGAPESPRAGPCRLLRDPYHYAPGKGLSLLGIWRPSQNAGCGSNGGRPSALDRAVTPSRLSVKSSRRMAQQSVQVIRREGCRSDSSIGVRAAIAGHYVDRTMARSSACTGTTRVGGRHRGTRDRRFSRYRQRRTGISGLS